MSKQTSLLSFFNKDKIQDSSSTPHTSDKVHKYFYLEWNDKKPVCHAHFLENKPKHISFEHIFHWNDVQYGFEMVLCGYIHQDKTFKIEKEKKYKNTGLLKSQLQKAIRRGDTQVAVCTAYHYLKLDIKDFLRRLPIIMLEDTILHNVFPTLIWLMIAYSTNEFVGNQYVIEYLMGIVYIMSENKLYFKYETTFEKRVLTYYLYEYNKKSGDIKNMCYALELRKSYGGMNCDMEMLENCAKYLNKNDFMINKNYYVTKIRPISLASISTLSLKEWIIESVDFHCIPDMIEYIIDEYDIFKNREDYIKGLIWHYSSKKNIRIKDDNKHYKDFLLEDWKMIEPYVKRLQNYLLELNY